eukprot:scaffold13354_cov60-Phaeocystis_antarctica.AAC.1
MDHDPPIETELIIENSMTGLDTHEVKRVTFTSSSSGVGGDNPTNPDDLSDEQWARMVTLNYQFKSCIYITYKVPARASNFGRNLLFSGAGSGSYTCTRPPAGGLPPMTVSSSGWSKRPGCETISHEGQQCVQHTGYTYCEIHNPPAGPVTFDVEGWTNNSRGEIEPSPPAPAPPPNVPSECGTKPRVSAGNVYDSDSAPPSNSKPMVNCWWLNRQQLETNNEKCSDYGDMIYGKLRVCMDKDYERRGVQYHRCIANNDLTYDCASPPASPPSPPSSPPPPPSPPCPHDYLTVNGDRYCDKSPALLVVADDTPSITWHSSSYWATAGWKLCW